MYTFPHPHSNPFKLSFNAISQRSRKSSQWELFTFYLLIKQTLGILLQTPQRTVCLGCVSSSLTSGLRAMASPGADRALSGKIHTNDRLPSVSFSRTQWEKKTLTLTEKLGALYLTVVLICISRRTGDVDHLYVHRLAICMPLQQGLLEWLSSKRQVITNASEDVEKKGALVHCW